ncbi:unnamed protein product [Effrenium voratum]|nr:unnamed protein product [Effrenium voratum]
MGWQLEAGGSTLLLLPGTAQIGRAANAQIRSSHQSVSRIHAEVVVRPRQGPLADVSPLEICIIDRSSTGHTFVNGQQPGRGTPQKLSEGDLLHFGVDPVRYKLCWRPMLVSFSSRLAPAELQQLEEKARATGTFLTPDWTPQCTHLLLEQFAITPKLLCCIIDGASPVSMAFLTELHRRVGEQTELRPAPPATEFAPLPAEGVDAAYADELSAYVASPQKRKDLLAGVWVIFSAKQTYDTLSVALSGAGCQVQLQTQDAAANVVLQELKRARGKPREVWVIPSLTPGLGAVLAQPLAELRCPVRVVSQQAVVGAILAGSNQRIQSQAPLPKAELESFPETHPTHTRPEMATQRKRQIPWESKAGMRVKEESFPNTVQEPGLCRSTQHTKLEEEKVDEHEALGGARPVQHCQQPDQQREEARLQAEKLQKEQLQQERLQQERLQQEKEKLHQEKLEQERRQQELLQKERLVQERLQEERRLEQQRQEERRRQQQEERRREERRQQERCQEATQHPAAQLEGVRDKGSLQQSAPSLIAPKLEEEKMDFGTVHSNASLSRRADVKEEELPQIIDGVEPNLHPTNTWLPSLQRNSKRALVLDGAELPRATWFTTTKRREPERQEEPASGRPNFKRFRKAQSSPPTRLVACVPWAPARNFDVFASQPTMDAESEIPRLGM